MRITHGLEAGLAYMFSVLNLELRKQKQRLLLELGMMA